MPTETRYKIGLANDQLNRVLGFFARLDAKHSVVLAIDTGMLAFLAARSPALGNLLGWLGVAPGLTLILLAISIGYLYAGGSPNLLGGEQSLTYFREIAKRTEGKYTDAFLAVSDEEYLKDLLGQVWRNSEILAAKFDHLKRALLFLALAIIPWLVAITTFVLRAAAPR